MQFTHFNPWARYLTGMGIMSPSRLGAFNPRARYLTGWRLGQDSSDFDYPICGQAGSTSSTAAASSSSNFLNEDSLGLGLPNIAYLGIGVALVFLLKKR